MIFRFKPYHPVILCLCMLLSMAGCRKRKEKQEPFVNVNLTLDTTGTKLSDVEYFVFDNENDFSNAVNTQAPRNFMFSGKGDNSLIQFTGLSANREYYIYVRSYDTLSYPGYSLLYTNEEANFMIPATPPESQMKANLKLKPQQGLVTLLPDNSGGTFTSSGSGINTIFGPEGKTIVLRKGSYSFRTKNNAGGSCVWFKNISVVPGKIISVNHEPCDGQVIFYTSEVANIQARVVLGINDSLDRISSVGFPADCEATGYPKAALTAGTYTYYAFLENGTMKCAWTDTFTIRPGDCKRIELKQCLQ